MDRTSDTATSRHRLSENVTTVIGIDFSTTPERTGMAKALVDVASMSAKLCNVRTATKLNPPFKIAASWIRNIGDDARVLIAIDAPLGWPEAMREYEFMQHVAGQRLNHRPDMLFLRETDRWIEQRFNKKPFAVGADKIARTAHAALDFLGRLADELHVKTMPLAQSPEDVREYTRSVIEVYPAATLLAHKIDTGRYKKPGNDGMRDRKRIIKRIVEELQLGRLKNDIDLNKVARNDNTVDAVVCVLASLDFLVGHAESPDSRIAAIVGREGWIWAKTPPG